MRVPLTKKVVATGAVVLGASLGVAGIAAAATSSSAPHQSPGAVVRRQAEPPDLPEANDTPDTADTPEANDVPDAPGAAEKADGQEKSDAGHQDTGTDAGEAGDSDAQD